MFEKALAYSRTGRRAEKKLAAIKESAAKAYLQRRRQKQQPRRPGILSDRSRR
jgi:hypothetical protein